jgi:C4-dicarboxylate transporter
MYYMFVYIHDHRINFVLTCCTVLFIVIVHLLGMDVMPSSDVSGNSKVEPPQKVEF